MPLSPKPLLDSHLVQAPPPCSGTFLSLYPLSRVVSFQGFHRNHCFLLPHQVRYLHMPYSSHYCSCPSPWSLVPSFPPPSPSSSAPSSFYFFVFFFYGLGIFDGSRLTPSSSLSQDCLHLSNERTMYISSTCTSRCLWIIFFVHAHLYRGTLTRSSSEFDLCMSYLRHISSARSSSSLGIFFGMEIQGSMSWRQKVLPTYITSIRIGIVSTIMVPHLHCFGGVGIMDILCVHTHMQLAVGNDPRAHLHHPHQLHRKVSLAWEGIPVETHPHQAVLKEWLRVTTGGQDNPCEAMWGCNPIRGKIYWLGSSTNIYGLYYRL